MPVVTGDLHPDTFGMGSFIFQNDTTEEPENPAAEEAAEADTDETDGADTDVVVWVDPAAEKTAPDDPDIDAADSDDAALPITEPVEGTGDAADGFEVRGNASPTGTEDEGETPQYLTYSSDHNYVLSSIFTVEQKASPAILMTPPMRASSDHVDGRDYFGQVSVDIDGTTYILIGDRQQLDAINDDATIRTDVCGPVFKATEGAVEVWRTNLHLAGDWMWLSEFDGSKELKDGNGYGTSAEEVIASYQALASGASVIYPGDADLIDLGTSGDFSESPLYDTSSGSYHKLDRPGGTATSASSSRDIYFTTNTSGVPDLSTATLVASDPTVGTLKYEKNGKYIVFRDIDMTKGALTSYGTQWKPLMFTGEMYGVKASDTNPTLWDSGHTQMNPDPRVKPVISNINVRPVSVTVQENFQSVVRLDLDIQTGVGFFGTLTGSINDSDLIGSKCLVKNIKLYNGTVTNDLEKAAISETLVNGLLTFLGTALGVILDPVLSGLLGKEIHLRDTLVGLLNTRAADPTSLATGAFAGRVIGNAAIEDCEVEAIAVSAVKTTYEDSDGDGSIDDNDGKIVGLGGFVGHSEGVTTYDLVSLGLGTVTDALASLLNVIPGLGLGDLINVLLTNALPLRDLIPTGYVSPEITNCTVNNGTLSTNDGKYGVGGFAGSLVGTVVTDCTVKNSQMTVNAHHFGGGFAGVARDGIIKGTLAGLGIDVLAQLHPQTELVRCSIENTEMNVTGGWYLGGFVGVLANSYCINDDIDADTVLTVTGQRDYIGGFVGYARLGTLVSLGDYLEENASLLSTVKEVAAGLLGTGGDQSLLDLGGIAFAAILGIQNDAETTVSSTGGSYVGGIVGRGDGVMISRSDDVHLRKLPKYKRQRSGEYVNALPITAAQARDNHVTQLLSVSAANNFAGGIAGYLTTANVGGLLGDTLGLAQFLGFEVSHTYINCHTDGTGAPDSPAYTVTAGVYDASTGENTTPGDYAGGAIGWAVGGDIFDVECKQLQAVKANNRAAGFVGTTGPGDLANGGGLDLTLLGLTLLKVNNLLSLFSGVRTTYLRANVTGIADGFTVEETGMITSQLITYTAGGYAAEANSVRFVDCHVNNLLSVKANLHDGVAGGYVAYSSAGNVAGLVDEEHTAGGNLLELNQLIDAIPLLVPSYDGCDVNYVNGGFVEGDTAGGFAGEFMSGKVNTYTMEVTEIDDGAGGTNTYVGVNPIDDPNTPYTYTVGNSGMPWSVNNIHHVRGGNYGGGWGGHVYPGALASAGGGLSILGAADTSGISADDLLGVADVYIPIIKYAGVNAPNGFTVYAAYDYDAPDDPATGGCAGGFIGYGQSVQISYCDVNMLAHRAVTEPDAFTSDDNSAYGRIGLKPDELESQDGSNYLDYSSNDPDEIPYAVAGAYYAGGYIGHMDIGSAASVGDKLRLLGDYINLTNVLSVLNVVVSIVEHSDVYGAPGGFSVLASPHVNLGDGLYGEKSTKTEGEGDNAVTTLTGGPGVSYAGGFAGKIAGGHVQDSNCRNFAYIVAEVAAGGYVGEMVPGVVAKVLENDTGETNSVFDKLVQFPNLAGVATIAQDFVPTIRNSETTCIPCGGAVRAESQSDRTNTRGMAGGYVGHCVGGQIWGMSNDRWKDENDNENHYIGPQRTCTAHRIRSVYGAEYAGGFAGFVEAGSTADVGSFSVLGSLLRVENLAGLLKAAYTTIKHASVTGPLRGIDEQTWNAWKAYVGANGQFSSELLTADFDDLEDFIYGTHVVAGRHKFANYPNTFLSGCAGGFAGSMHSGVIEDSKAWDTKLVLSMRGTGGFAGEMQTGDLADVGGISLLGLQLNLGELAPNIGSVLVPAVKNGEIHGYSHGLQVGATGAIGIELITGTDVIDEAFGVPKVDGNPEEAGVGCAGGFVGAAYGGQMTNTGVYNLKRVKGTLAVGGYAGRADAAAIAAANTSNVSHGILQQILNRIISSKGDLLDVLHATVCTINGATVESIRMRNGDYEPYGFIVDGKYLENGDTKYALYAGGFAGQMQATLVNTKKGSVTTETVGEGAEAHEVEVFMPDTTADDQASITVKYLRGVDAGHYTGGFVGLASVGSVTQIGGENTNILGLLNVGNVGLLDVFRTYIYNCSVEGVDDGFCTYAHEFEETGSLQGTDVSVASGGFVGCVMSGTIKNCSVAGLNTVDAPIFTGGFCGHSGTKSVLNLSGVAVDENSAFGRLLAAMELDLSASLQLMNTIGSTFEQDTVIGFGGGTDGFVIKSTYSETEENLGTQGKFVKGACAGGFAGYADVAQIADNCQALNIRKVVSTQIAGGFVGRTSVSHLADVEASDDLVGALTWIVDLLFHALLLDKLEQINLINLYGEQFGLQLLAEGNLLKVNLFGMAIGVSIASSDPETGAPTAITVILGSSEITLPIGTDGEIDTTNLTIELFELTSTLIRDALARGIDPGYDVFGGNATQYRDGRGELGYAGGFVGLNDHGRIRDSKTELCDTVCGAPGKTGPFTGGRILNENATVPQTPETLEGENNIYYIYRENGVGYAAATMAGGETISMAETDAASVPGKTFNRYEIKHVETIESLSELAGAKEIGTVDERLLKAYHSTAKYVGMNDTYLADNHRGQTPMAGEKKDPCDENPPEITVQKIWEDNYDAQQHRPAELLIHLAAVDVGTTPPARMIVIGRPNGPTVWSETLIMTESEHGDVFSDTWFTMIRPDFQMEEGHYYQYYVIETEPKYYSAVYQIDFFDSDAATVEITNSDKLLPDTGGEGTAWLLLAGLLLLLCAILLLGASLTWKKWGTLTRRNTAA